MLRVEKAVACIISLSILALGQIAWAQDQAIEPMTLVPGADYSETVMPGQAPMRHENRSWIEDMPETLIACGNGCTDMREAHFHIKRDAMQKYISSFFI